ncbi:acyl-coenzyme A diphosphatase NUDT19 [Anticarsia gemmatalis]|uniref:acyl-coenzyme A diphosphatase NUDT19 n=1 Tax=Anticarsia gemmatalis TaxID=129554 RepID=UPI003F767706
MKNIIGKSWRDSASLIVLTKRNSELLSRVEDRGGVNYDILLQTRTRTASFANSVVFPGGVSEPIDGSQRWLHLLAKFGYSKQDFQAFHHPSGAITPIFQKDPIQRHIELRITAIRETFEELGLLICSRQHKEERDGTWAGIIEDIDVAYWQNRVEKNPDDWLVLCEEHKCYPDIWSLSYWSNWLTPVTFKRRFNTAFFIAGLEQKPANITSSSEVADIEWLSPEAVLKSDKILYPPQLYELTRLSHVKDIKQLIKFASERSGYDSVLSYPVIVKAKDGMLHLLPGDDLYPTSVDYNDNTIKYIDKTVLELREGSKIIHRVEAQKESKRLLIQNYKPEHHVNMEDLVVPAFDTV